MPKEVLHPAILDPFAATFRVMTITDEDIAEEMNRADFAMLRASTEMKLKQTGIEFENILDDEHIKFSTEKKYFIFDENKPVLVYIRDQIVNILNYERGKFTKFHLCFCDALETADEESKFSNRYIATTRTTGDFFVNIKIAGHNDYVEKEVYKPLLVCQNCLRKLNWKHFADYCGDGTSWWLGGNPRERNRIVKNFSIAEFLEYVEKKNIKQRSLFEGADRRLSSNTTIKQYELTQREKNELKHRRNYRCEKCGKITLPRYLQIHHRDHNEGNNSYDNLMVVCKSCHDEIHRKEGGVQFMPR